MKKTIIFFPLIILILFLCSCSTIAHFYDDLLVGKAKFFEKCSEITHLPIPEDVKIDYYSDTHAGFLGDGELTVIVDLNAYENEKILNEIKYNQNFSKGLTEDQKDYYKSMTDSRFPLNDDSYFLQYSKNDEKVIPITLDFIPNYFFIEYSPKEGMLYIFEFDS